MQQEVVSFPNYAETKDIVRNMRAFIEEGWRVHTCLERGSEVIVVYEKEADTWNWGD